MTVSKEAQDYLPTIKKNINAAHVAQKDNSERYYAWKQITFKSSISTSERQALDLLDRPVVEFNILNAPVSRLCGEFSKQEPQIYVSMANGEKADEAMLEAVEGHLKHILFEASKHNYQYRVYKDSMGGGLSSWKVCTDYLNERSFEQSIFLKRPDRPASVLFDPCAVEPTKSDAKYWCEPYPVDVEELKEEYPNEDFSSVKFTSFESIDGSEFNWAFTSGNGKKKYIVVCDYYEIKTKKKKLVKLSNGSSMTYDEYEDMLEEHELSSMIEQPPAIVDTRMTNVPYVCRYVCIYNKVLKYEKTSFTEPNYIFVDGDSEEIRESDNSSIVTFTKPYCFHGLGIQKLTNLSGQAIAADFENITMHKFMVSEEALPSQQEFLTAYKNVQKASVLVYRETNENNPQQRNSAPMPVARVPLPQEVISTFNNCMSMLQNILGSYDASLGIQNNQLSGVAIVEGATQSNAAAMPYIVNYMQSLNQAAQVIVNIMPKFLITPRSIPIIDKKGNRAFVSINGDGQPKLSYEAGDLHVKVEAGVSFAIAKDRAIKQITSLMSISPIFERFINEVGLNVLLDNLDFHGVEIVKEKADEFMQKIQQEQQQPTPEQQTANARFMDAQTNAAKQQSDAKTAMYKNMIDAKNAESTEKEADTNRLKALTGIGESQQKLAVEASEVAAEESRTRAQTALAVSEHMLDKQRAEHEQLKDIIGMANDKNKNNSI